MSLSDILDEISDDTESVDKDLVIDKDKLSAEEILSMTVTSDKKHFTLNKLDVCIINKFNQLYSRCRIQATIKDLVKVDRSLAQEAFATLPESSKTDEAKLTSYPSAINRALLDEIVFTGNDEVPSDLIEVIGSVLEEVRQSLPPAEIAMTEVELAIDTLVNLVESKFATNRPIVIYDNESHDLVNGDLNNLLYVDDTKLLYDKYAGKLTKTINELIFSSGFRDYLSFLDDNSIRSTQDGFIIVEIIDKLKQVKQILKGNLSDIKQFKEDATTYLEGGDRKLSSQSAELVNSLESVIDASTNFNKINLILKDKDGFVSMLINFVNFLD